MSMKIDCGDLADSISQCEEVGLGWSIHNYANGGGVGAFVHKAGECFQGYGSSPAKALADAFRRATSCQSSSATLLEEEP
jgi:hypothetical protein